jgi:hypothetical protein
MSPGINASREYLSQFGGGLPATRLLFAPNYTSYSTHCAAILP